MNTYTWALTVATLVLLAAFFALLLIPPRGKYRAGRDDGWMSLADATREPKVTPTTLDAEDTPRLIAICAYLREQLRLDSLALHMVEQELALRTYTDHGIATLEADLKPDT